MYISVKYVRIPFWNGSLEKSGKGKCERHLEKVDHSSLIILDHRIQLEQTQEYKSSVYA